MCSLMQARRLLFPGGIPGHRFLRSAVQRPTANLSCAVAFDAHNINMAAIIKMIFTGRALLPTLSHPASLPRHRGRSKEAKAAFRAAW
jgi:hypothetical protein